MKKESKNRIPEELTPRCEFKASEKVMRNVMAAARKEVAGTSFAGKDERGRNFLHRRMYVYFASAAAAVVVVALIGYSLLNVPAVAIAAGKVFLAAIESREEGVVRYEIAVKVRAKESSFAAVDHRDDFVKHKMTVDLSSGRWIVEKPIRTAVFDGQYTWSWEYGGKYLLRWDGEQPGVIEAFALLTDPYALLAREKKQVEENPFVSCDMETSGDTITLTVKVPAMVGRRDYMRNTSFVDTDTRRVYKFEKSSGKLVYLRVEGKYDRKYIDIAELSSIEYGIDPSRVDFTCPEGLVMRDMMNPGGPTFMGISPEEAAVRMLKALAVQDGKVLDEACPYGFSQNILDLYSGSVLLKQKKHRKSLGYAGVLVPCKVRLNDGRVIWLRLAIRNDNPMQAWIFDGGL